MKRILQISTGLTLGLVVTLGAIAQVKPEVLVKQRQAKMILQGKYFGPMAAMAQGKAPYNAAVMQRNAGFLDNLTRMAWDGYDPSTRNAQSRTKPSTYDNMAKFKEYGDRLENQVSQLVTLSKGSDEGAVKAQIGAIGKTCGGCHNDFRSD